MSLNDRYNPAMFADEEDEPQGTVAVPLHSNGAVTKLKFCILPHKCAVSGRILWLERAYRIRERYYSVNYSSPEQSVTYTWWVDKHEYIMEKLKA